MMNLYIDIETLPTNDAELIAAFAETITAPGQFKKPDSIAEWMAANKEAALAELVAKTSFDGLYGHIACIAWAFDDGEVHSSLASDTEQQVIHSLYDSVRQSVKFHSGGFAHDVTVIGHNVAGFDLPFLKHRSIIHGIKPQPDLRKAMGAKPWDVCIADTMLMWSTDSKKYASMDKLCKAFGIEGKGDFNGSMVANEWANGSKQKVIDYCKDDVRRTREMYKRITFSECAENMYAVLARHVISS